MTKYKIIRDGVLDQEAIRSIPDRPDNRHWIKYQEWLAEGNTPDPEFSPEEIEAQERESQQSARIETLKQATVDQFDFIAALFQVGRDKGLWTAQDFPEELRSKLVEWKQLVDDIRANSRSGIAITRRQGFIK